MAKKNSKKRKSPQKSDWESEDDVKSEDSDS